MHFDKLFALMRDAVLLTQADQELIASRFQPISFARHTRLVQPGGVARWLYFINAGYLRIFAYREGVEVTTHLNCPPGFITSFRSFNHQVPAADYLECITDVELLAISRQDLDYLYRQSAHLSAFGRLMLEQSVTYNETRSQDLVALSAGQRYQKLLRQHPDIIQHVPLQYIASFIGIKPESLSRIRRQIIS
jgi:CRP-like cAMP-binding protein